MITKIPLNDECGEPFEEPFPKLIFQTVYESLDELGYDVPDPNKYEVTDGADGPVAGAGILPAFMVGTNNDIPDLVRTGIGFPFDFEERLDATASKSQKNHATKQFVEAQMSIPEAIKELHNRGEISLAIDKISQYLSESPVPPDEVVAFALTTYSKGWIVESILASHDRFEVGDIGDESSGYDLYDAELKEWVQVKSVTNMASKSRKKLDAHSVRYIYYQFDCAGNLVIGEEPNVVNGAAAEVKNISKTLIKRCHSTYKYEGRTYRYLWW